MAASPRRVDRRVQRTRQLLQDAFIAVVREKGFTATSIQDVAERANVNRGTFYIHYTDKYMLLDTIIREKFRQHLASTLPPEQRWDRETLLLLIQTVLDYFERKYHHQQHSLQVLAPVCEPAIQEELTSLLLTWLKQGERGGTRGRVPPETIARVSSWAIFGTAIQWSQEESAISLERMARDILLIVVEGMERLAPVLQVHPHEQIPDLHH